MKFRVVVAVVVCIAAYITTISLYASTGLGNPTELIHGKSAADETAVTLDLNEVHSARGELVASATVHPPATLLDPVNHGLTEDLSVAVDSGVTRTTRTWTKGSTPGAFPVILAISGNPGSYPFDHYSSGPTAVDITVGDSNEAVRVWPSFVDRAPGWMFKVQTDADSNAPAVYRVDLRRSPSTAAVAAIILAAMITIAALAMVVSIQTARNRRKFQPPMTTWFAAMLFAVVPLRNALPDAPLLGTWIDVTVVLWVIVALVASMALYVVSWWRHLNPESTRT